MPGEDHTQFGGLRVAAGEPGKQVAAWLPGAPERSGAALIEKYLMVIRPRPRYATDRVR